jgi:hypothetical protein
MEPYNGLVTILYLIKRIFFVYEKLACQLAVINMADINSDSDNV